MKDLNNMYQIKRHEKSRRIIYKIGVLNEKRCKTAQNIPTLFYLLHNFIQINRILFK
jgi:hypothetical protein